MIDRMLLEFSSQILHVIYSKQCTSRISTFYFLLRRCYSNFQSTWYCVTEMSKTLWCSSICLRFTTWCTCVILFSDNDVSNVLARFILLLRSENYLQWSELDVTSFRIEMITSIAEKEKNKTNALTRLLVLSQL